MRNAKRKYIEPGISFTRAIYHQFFSEKKNRRRAFYNVKESLDFPDLCQATDFIDRNINNKFKEYLYGKPLPKNYSELGNSDFPYVGNDFISEINWTLISLRKYSYQVNLFLEYKQIYENNLLIGNYQEAEHYLTKIEEKICCSLWTLENRFLLKEFAESSAENKEFLSKFNEENQANGFTKSLAHFLSLRAERGLSVNRYISDLENSLHRMEGAKKQEHIDYYLFKLSFLNHLKFSKYIEIIAYDFPHSIIDRYLNLRKVFSILLTTSNAIVDKIEYGKTLKVYIINRLNYLTKKINDPILYKLKLFAGDKLFPAFNEAEGFLLISIIDKYTTGLYSEMEEDLSNLLLNNATQFDLYHLYIKSLIFQKKAFIPIGNKKSLQNQILSEMYKIVSVSGNPAEAGANLLRFANNLSACTLSYGIIDFVNFKTKGKEERKLFARLSYNQANPITHEIFNNSELQIDYLTLLKSKYPNSITIDFFLNKAQNIDNILNFEKKLPEMKYKVEYANSLQNKGEFEDALNIWEYLIEKFTDTIPVLETAIKNLFICYEKLKRYDDCISLYVESFFANNYIVEKIEVESLLLKIKENRFRVVKPTIELAIFYTIANADENETHITFERFNLKNDAEKPSELLPLYSKFAEHKILFYLKYTCGSEILKHSTFISSSKERLEERLIICQFLREKDIEDKVFYDDEIKNISNILVMQKGLLELDESKIYVNEQGIIASELREYEAIFLRFKTIAKIAEKSNVWMLNKYGTLTTVNYSEERTESQKVEYSSNPVYDIYKELFDAIRGKFLHSKFGIVQYLSSRIRHGVLLGEIRPIFEKHALITLKDGESQNYRRNLYWDNVYKEELPINQTKLQVLLRDFSGSVDGLIFDLIQEHLQVYDPIVKINGWFNYDFEDEDLFWFSISALHSRDFNHFAQQVFEILWARTDTNLELIRGKIQNEIAQSFNDLFNRFEKDILDLYNSNKSMLLINSLKACSTETQAVIMRISSWFKRSGTTASDFFLDYVIDIVIEHANKTHSNKKVQLEKDIKCNCKISGEYLTHFADLLRIFIENILKHAGDQFFVIPTKIKTELIKNDYISIVIENQITNKDSLDALKNTWTQGKMDITKLSSEGKSGYHKANKILKYDLKCEDNKFCTDINETEDKFSVSMFINTNVLLA